MRFHQLCLVVLSVLGGAACKDDGGEEPSPQTESRVDPLILGVLTIPGEFQVKVLTASVGMATPTNTPHHDYDDRVNGFGCNANHLDTTVSPPDINPGPVEGGIVTITGYSGGTMLDGTEAPKVITCKHSETPSPRYTCGYGPLNANGEVGPLINATPYPIDANPIRDGDVITFSSTGSGPFGSFPVQGQPPTTATATGDLTASLNDIKFDPAQDTVIEVSCPGGCGGVATARINASRTTEPRTTAGGGRASPSSHRRTPASSSRRKRSAPCEAASCPTARTAIPRSSKCRLPSCVPIPRTPASTRRRTRSGTSPRARDSPSPFRSSRDDGSGHRVS